MNYMIPQIDTPEMKAQANWLGIVTSRLGKRVTKIAQVNPTFKEAGQIATIEYTMPNEEREMVDMPVWDKHRCAVKYRTLNFLPDVYPSQNSPSGTTGRVAYLWVDDEPTPKGSRSGRQTGYNLEFLASHFVFQPIHEAFLMGYGLTLEGVNPDERKPYFYIVDSDIREEVMNRAIQIQKSLAENPYKTKKIEPRHMRSAQMMYGDNTNHELAAILAEGHRAKKHEAPDMLRLRVENEALKEKLNSILSKMSPEENPLNLSKKDINTPAGEMTWGQIKAKAVKLGIKVGTKAKRDLLKEMEDALKLVNAETKHAKMVYPEIGNEPEPDTLPDIVEGGFGS